MDDVKPTIEPVDARHTDENRRSIGGMVAQIASMQDYDRYRDLSWEGSFEEYLQIIRQRPQVTRNAFQRVYDMIISYGSDEYIDT